MTIFKCLHTPKRCLRFHASVPTAVRVSIMQEELTVVRALLNHQTNGDCHGDGDSGTDDGNAVDREKNVLYKRFNKFRPRYFKPHNDPSEANEWIEHMEEIFEVMDCTERQKAVLAAFKLEGKAKPWWKAAEKTFDGEETKITWSFFKNAFF